jgi:serine/threonine protein kinase
MSGKVPYEAPIAKMIEVIKAKTKDRPRVEKFSDKLNNLVNRMLTINVAERITLDEILEAVGDTDYCINQMIDAN